MTNPYTPPGGTGPADTAPAYLTLQEFVEDFLVHVYARQVRDTHSTVWCPQWWRHPEAVLRLQALHRAFEALRTQGGPLGGSTWWLDHADPHMRHLLCTDGPFRYCGVRNGHKDMLRSLPVDPAPLELFVIDPGQSA